MKNYDLTCPKCGALLKADRRKGVAVCDYCGYHMQIEKEYAAEEIFAAEQAKSYGYHKGRLKAEAEVIIAQKFRALIISGIVFGIVALMVIIPAFAGYLMKPAINPFDYIQVSFQGNDGRGVVEIEMLNVSEDVDINRVDFDISKKSQLLQGEAITIQASSDDYRLSETTKTYVVEGLDEYLKDLENIPNEALEIIHTQAESSLKLNLQSSKDSGHFIDMEVEEIRTKLLSSIEGDMVLKELDLSGNQ